MTTNLPKKGRNSNCTIILIDADNADGYLFHGFIRIPPLFDLLKLKPFFTIFGNSITNDLL